MKKSLLVVLVIAIVSFIVSLFVLYTPIPSNDPDGFSAVRVASYIEAFSREPHSVYDPEAHEDVRVYLEDTLKGFVGDANVTEMDYPASQVGDDVAYDIRNLLAVIPGTSSSGVLLVAHYDSRGHIGRNGELGRSYGAADDGYGIATLLEIARLYSERSGLVNSIYLLATDGEETGLYGASLAAQEDFMDNIGLVINLEARGVDGAAYMFETSTDNNKLIDFYKNAELPVAYSLATAVYTVMPNLTDFTEFLAIGKQGLNFAVLKGLYNYHTPFDNYTAIDLSSIQHYGSQIVPLVEEFVTDSAYSDVNYFQGTTDDIFFTILPGVFITYSETLGTVLNIVTLVLFLALVVYLVWKKETTVKAFFKYLGLLFAAIVVFAVLGLYISKLIAWLGGTTWSLTYVRMTGSEIPTLVILLGCILFFGWLLKSKTAKTDYKAVMLAGIFVNLLLALVTGFVLSGASFLFFVPAFFGVISLIVISFVKNRIVRHVALSQNIIWNMLLLVPLLFSLFLALTVGGLLALLVILIINISIVLPSVFLQLDV